MVGKPAEFLRVQPELTRHLDMQIAQVKSLLGFRPCVEASFGLLHDASPSPSRRLITMRHA
jgi:hypothetical protein